MYNPATTAAGTGAATLAATGANTLLTTALGLVLAVAGLVLLRARKQRGKQAPSENGSLGR